MSVVSEPATSPTGGLSPTEVQGGAPRRHWPEVFGGHAIKTE